MKKKKPRRNKRFGAIDVLWRTYGHDGPVMYIGDDWYTLESIGELIEDIEKAIEYIRERA